MLGSDLPTKNVPLLAPGGYYIALRLGFAFATRQYNGFPEDWKKFYTKNSLMPKDPMIAWAYNNSGTTRWADLKDQDKHGIFSAAAHFGLKYGVVISLAPSGETGNRSFGIFASGSREFTESETFRLFDAVSELHQQAAVPKLTKAELEALNWIKDGYRMKEAAYSLGISESAVKARLTSAKHKLGARNSTHAASLAVRFGLIWA